MCIIAELVMVVLEFVPNPMPIHPSISLTDRRVLHPYRHRIPGLSTPDCSWLYHATRLGIRACFINHGVQYGVQFTATYLH